MEATTFLRHLYGESEGFLSLWRGDTKRTTWVEFPGQAEKINDFVKSAARDKFDAYFGVCLHRESSGERSRGNIAKVGVVPGIWADVDFRDKDQGDKKSVKIYPTEDQAAEAIKALGIAPTISVNSGGGVHLYWLFDEPFLIDDEADRDRIAGVVKGFQGRLRTILLKQCGASLDSTHDLARVLRIPGSIHTRVPDHVVNVGICNEFRYPVSKFEVDELPQSETKSRGKAQAAPKQPKKPKTAGTSDLPATLANFDSDPPGSKLYNLCEADQKFKRVFDNSASFDSPSESDMSLANYAIGAGWTPEETAALLVSFSRKHYPARVDKVLRVSGGIQDYLHRTIAKAFDSRRAAEASAKSSGAAESLAAAMRKAQESGESLPRETILSHITTMLGISIVAFRKTGSGRSFVYSLDVLPAGRKKPIECIIGSSKQLAKPDETWAALVDSVDHVFTITKKIRAEWGAIVQSLISIVERHEVIEVSYTDRARGLIEDFLQRGCPTVQTNDQRSDCLLNQRPYIEAGKLIVPGPKIHQLAGERDKDLQGRLFNALRSAGWKRKTISARGTSRSVWIMDSPAAYLSIVEAGGQTQLSVLARQPPKAQ